MRKTLFILMASAFCCAPAAAQLLTGEPDISESQQHNDFAPQPASPEALQALEPAASSSSDEPLEITADNSLEWQRNDKTFIARGNALAQQGEVSIAAQTLTAKYDEQEKGGGMKISKVTAEEGVIIKSKDSEAFGSRADYDLDKGYAVMTGNNLKLVSPDQIVTANDKFEYWTTNGKLAATGRAKATRGTDTLEADKLSAIMKDGPDGKRVLDTLEATGNVIITTPTEKATGAYAVYKAATDKAEMKGGVKIFRGPNILEGERAEVDMNTNTSRIFGNPGDRKRVKGVFYPNSEKKS